MSERRVANETLRNVYDPSRCEGEPCPIHHPSQHKMLTREQAYDPATRTMHRLCEHDIPHPDPDDPAARTPRGTYHHPCDGCCRGVFPV